MIVVIFVAYYKSAPIAIKQWQPRVDKMYTSVCSNSKFYKCNNIYSQIIANVRESSHHL